MGFNLLVVRGHGVNQDSVSVSSDSSLWPDGFVETTQSMVMKPF